MKTAKELRNEFELPGLTGRDSWIQLLTIWKGIQEVELAAARDPDFSLEEVRGVKALLEDVEASLHRYEAMAKRYDWEPVTA